MDCSKACLFASAPHTDVKIDLWMKMDLNQLVELPGTRKSTYCIFPSVLSDDHLNQSRVESRKVSIIYNLRDCHG